MWNEEKDEYIKKLETQEICINKILRLRNQSDLIKKSLEEKLIKIQEKICNLKNKLKNNEFEIAIVGLEKTGKSSFANALIESNILPSKDSRCTYTSTCIRYGENIAEVNFFEENEFNKEFQKKLKALKIPNYNNFKYNTLTIKEYENMINNIKDENKEIFTILSNTVNNDVRNIIENSDSLAKYIGASSIIFKGKELESDEFKSYIESKNKAIAVKNIIIKSNQLSKMKNAVIYDVPGFDSPTQIHEDQTLEKMRKADAIVLLVNTSKPSFTGPQVSIFNKYSDEDGITLSEKLFIFGNQTDRASNVSKNVKELENEIYEEYGILKKENSARFIYGSAKAHLQKIGKENGTEIIDRMNELGLNDNIEKIRCELEKYNINERFSIIKSKVNKIFNDINELFEDMLKKYDKEEMLDGSLEIHIAYSALTQSKEKIKNNLELLKRKINSNPPQLSKKLNEKIKQALSLEKFKATNEEIEKIHNKVKLGTGNNIVVSKVENKLRDKKYKELYDMYLKLVLDIAIDEESEIFNNILNIFIEGISIEENSVYYDELRNGIEEFLKSSNKLINKINMDGYYKSLIERFSSDLFELLILYPYGSIDRWRKFESSKNDYYSLAMFSKDKEENLPINKQPLIYKLLFHNNPYDIVQEVENIILTNVGINLSSELKNIIFKIAMLNKNEILKILKENFEKFDKNMDEDKKYIVVKTMLERILDNKSKDNIDLAVMYKELNSINYDKKYDDIIKEINGDIEILKHSVLNAVIPAIHLEKPFIAKQIKIIEDILDLLNKEEFESFMADNIKKIKASEFKELDKKIANETIRKNIIEEIKLVLEEMDQ